MILVLTSHPIRQVLQNLDVYGRVTKCAIELGEFDIKFVLKTAIKGQAITDFMAKFMYLTKVFSVATYTSSTLERHKKDDKSTDLSNVWSLRIDGSSNVSESGAGVILESQLREDQLCPKDRIPSLEQRS